jgi:hypothetical protein
VQENRPGREAPFENAPLAPTPSKHIHARKAERSMTRSTSGYARVNGLSMYYELHGAGQPLVLLHGALSAIGTSFGKLLPELVGQLPNHAALCETRKEAFCS